MSKKFDIEKFLEENIKFCRWNLSVGVIDDISEILVVLELLAKFKVFWIEARVKKKSREKLVNNSN
jgi:hypothetical protein